MLRVLAVHNSVILTMGPVSVHEENLGIDLEIGGIIRGALEEAAEFQLASGGRDLYFVYVEIKSLEIGKETEATPFCSVIATPFADKKDDHWRKMLIDYLNSLDFGMTVMDKQYGEHYAVCISDFAQGLDAQDVSSLIYPYADLLRAETQVYDNR
jgi:hypothetical protein